MEMHNKARWWPVVLGTLMFSLGLAGTEVWAQSFDLSQVQRDGIGIGRTILGLILVALTVVGGAEIVRGLAEARQKGGWGHFLWGVAMVMISFFAFIGFLKMGGHSAESISRDFQIK
jgi:uncharacterized membrane protein HdeD (DUF308 family)